MEPKLCQMCKKRHAVLHVAQLSNNKYISIDLCEQCAEKKGMAISSSVAFSAKQSLTEIFQGLLNKEEKQDASTPLSANKKTCPGCQRTYEDFRESGRLGCAQCYAAFSPQLAQLISKMHRSKQHRGKVPELSSERFQTQRSLVDFKERLRRAVGNEEFEEAARLRDHIRDLEQQLQ